MSALRVHCGLRVSVGAGVGGHVWNFAGAVAGANGILCCGCGCGWVLRNHVGAGRGIFPKCGCGAGVGDIYAPAQGSSADSLLMYFEFLLEYHYISETLI